MGKLEVVLLGIEEWTLRVAPFVASLAVPLAIVAVFFWVPTDAGLGLSQRIFYFHVPCATASFLAFAGAGVAGVLHLRSARSAYDHASHAAVGAGMLFATLVLITGSVWARTAWGTWWTWDARLTTFLVLWLVFASYLTLRSLGRENHMMPRYAAVLAAVGALNIPLVMMATRLWRTIHPQVIRNPEGGIDDSRMIATLALSFIAVFALFFWLWAVRARLFRAEERVAALEHSLS
jgi:heme exporter protein C